MCNNLKSIEDATIFPNRLNGSPRTKSVRLDIRSGSKDEQNKTNKFIKSIRSPERP